MHPLFLLESSLISSFPCYAEFGNGWLEIQKARLHVFSPGRCHIGYSVWPISDLQSVHCYSQIHHRNKPSRSAIPHQSEPFGLWMWNNMRLECILMFCLGHISGINISQNVEWSVMMCLLSALCNNQWIFSLIHIFVSLSPGRPEPRNWPEPTAEWMVLAEANS